MADFSLKRASQKWYNVISQSFLEPSDDSRTTSRDESEIKERLDNDIAYRQPVVKEESSDDSTIISSQTSTLTRNQDCDAFQPSLNINFQELVSCLQNTEDYDSEDTDDDDDDEEDQFEEGKFFFFLFFIYISTFTGLFYNVLFQTAFYYCGGCKITLVRSIVFDGCRSLIFPVLCIITIQSNFYIAI